MSSCWSVGQLVCLIPCSWSLPNISFWLEISGNSSGDGGVGQFNPDDDSLEVRRSRLSRVTRVAKSAGPASVKEGGLAKKKEKHPPRPPSSGTGPRHASNGVAWGKVSRRETATTEQATAAEQRRKGQQGWVTQVSPSLAGPRLGGPVGLGNES